MFGAWYCAVLSHAMQGIQNWLYEGHLKGRACGCREECEVRGATIVYATHIFDGLENWLTHLAFISQGKLLKGMPVNVLHALSMSAYRIHTQTDDAYGQACSYISSSAPSVTLLLQPDRLQLTYCSSSLASVHCWLCTRAQGLLCCPKPSHLTSMSLPLLCHLR